MEKFKKNLKMIFSNRIFIFIFAFTIMFLLLLGYKDLYGGSGDANQTWNVVTTFFKKHRTYSYVMYKGIYAFIPGVISYNLGVFFNINQFLFLKIINSLGFAYISTVGIPNLVKKLLNKKEIEIYKYYLFVLVFFLLENNVFCFISVDYYSATLFILLCNITIRLIENTKKTNLLLFGLFVGFNLSLSGQYSLATYLILVFITIKLVSANLKTISKNNIFKLLICLGVVLGGYMITSLPNAIYEEYVVNYGRSKGEWIPKGSDWVKTGMTRDMLIINYPITVPDNIGLSIMKARNDDIKLAKMGGSIYDYSDYVKIFMEYPIEFSTRIFERMFLGTINDYKNIGFVSSIHSNIKINLIAMITFLYMSLSIIKNKVKKVKDILNYKTIIVLSSMLTIVPPSLLHVENRYYLYLRSLIIGTAIFGSSFKINKINLKDIKDAKINYGFVSYIIFLILCIALYIAIYQSLDGASLL